MFGLEYILALIKILFNIAFAIITAIPFHIAWNNLAPKYLYFLPKVYQNTSYWEMVGLLLITIYVGEIIQRLTPKIVSITQTNSK